MILTYILVLHVWVVCALSYVWGSIQDVAVVKKQYDFIIIGGGSGGSTVANRLSEVSDWEVLLLEAGGDEDVWTDMPLASPVYGAHFRSWRYRTQPQRDSCLQHSASSCAWPKGKVLGGTSVINLMVYNRGNPADYDLWQQNGNYNWSYKHVLSYFKKSERLISLDGNLDLDYHGTEGFLNVEYPKYTTKLLSCFLQSAEELNYPVRDPNGEEQLGFSRVQATTQDGKRCSASKAYLHPVKHRHNLAISKHSHVTKILINDEKQAYGVEFIKNGRKHIVMAEKEVILSAGTINSPQILMLSGVGPKRHLEELNIKPIHDLKVGYNLQDHPYFFGLTFLINESVSIGTQTFLNPKNIYDYIINHQGPLTSPGGTEAIAFLKLNNSGLPDPRGVPDAEVVLGSGGLNVDFGPSIRDIIDIPEVFYQKVFAPIKNVPAFSLVPALLKTKSRGRVMLRSNNPVDSPMIFANFFKEQEDVHNLIQATRLAIEIGESGAFQRYNSTLHRAAYPGCEQWTWGSDEYWECCIRRYSNSLFHASGTCRMGPRADPTAVVDPRLRVHGVRGLRVVDASIMPTLVTGHPNAAVYMIGEKAADLIKQEWLGKH